MQVPSKAERRDSRRGHLRLGQVVAPKTSSFTNATAATTASATSWTRQQRDRPTVIIAKVGLDSGKPIPPLPCFEIILANSGVELTMIQASRSSGQVGDDRPGALINVSDSQSPCHKGSGNPLGVVPLLVSLIDPTVIGEPSRVETCRSPSLSGQDPGRRSVVAERFPRKSSIESDC